MTTPEHAPALIQGQKVRLRGVPDLFFRLNWADDTEPFEVGLTIIAPASMAGLNKTALITDVEPLSPDENEWLTSLSASTLREEYERLSSTIPRPSPKTSTPRTPKPKLSPEQFLAARIAELAPNLAAKVKGLLNGH